MKDCIEVETDEGLPLVLGHRSELLVLAPTVWIAGIVDENVDRREFFFRRFDHLLNGNPISDIRARSSGERCSAVISISSSARAE